MLFFFCYKHKDNVVSKLVIMSSSSSSVLKAREALLSLEKYVPTTNEKRQKEGVIFLLSSPNSPSVYVGCEYAGNLEKHLKELILRAEAFKLQGSIFHDSYPVMIQGEVRFELLEKVYVSSKYELGDRTLEYIEKIIR
jgi:hypothetical protein